MSSSMNSSVSSTPVHIFLDNSNIFYGAQGAAARHGEGGVARAVRLYYENLLHLARAGRQVEQAVCVGTIPPRDENVFRTRLERAGCTPELYPGTVGAREQGIDQALQVHMLRTVIDGWYGAPGVAVLLTGDGAGIEAGGGFLADLQRLYDYGWGVEVLSWEHSCSRRLRDWAEQVGAFVSLDAHYESVTFVAGGRRPTPPNLTRNRPFAFPANPEDMEVLAA